MNVTRSRHVIRRFVLWSVFKVSVVMSIVAEIATFCVAAIAVAFLRNAQLLQRLDQAVANNNVLESGWLVDRFQDGSNIRVGTIVAIPVVTAFLATLFAGLMNLVFDIVGGVETTVLSESLNDHDTAGRPIPGRSTSL